MVGSVAICILKEYLCYMSKAKWATRWTSRTSRWYTSIGIRHYVHVLLHISQERYRLNSKSNITVDITESMKENTRLPFRQRESFSLFNTYSFSVAPISRYDSYMIRPTIFHPFYFTNPSFIYEINFLIFFFIPIIIFMDKLNLKLNYNYSF